jgi:hypothetical protein
MQFPSLVASSLAGKRFELPNELEGDFNLLFVAFHDNQQYMIDTWLASADMLVTAYKRLKYYALPAMQVRQPFEQRVLEMGMRLNIRDPFTRAITIALYVDLEKFCFELAVANRDEICLFLIDESGDIVWRGIGAHNIFKEASLRETLETIFS